MELDGDEERGGGGGGPCLNLTIRGRAASSSGQKQELQVIGEIISPFLAPD